MLFGNIIYLLANDVETLEDISKLCGNQQTEKLRTTNFSKDLKLLIIFEAIILIPRIYPLKLNYYLIIKLIGNLVMKKLL